MSHYAMDDLKDIICKELEEIAEKGELSAGELDTVYKLIIAKEKLLRIEEIEEDLGYSNDGEWRATGNYSRDYMRNGNSYGRRHYVRGHYSNAGRRRYSMDDGRAEMANRIREMMDDESLTEQDRNALRKAMEQMER